MTTTEQKAFTITGGRGFQLKFPNGYIVSVQFGMGNYGDNRHLSESMNAWERTVVGEAHFTHGDLLAGFNGSDTAETAIIGPDGEFVPYDKETGLVASDDCYSDVQGWMTLMDVLKMLLVVASMPAQIAAPVEPEEVTGEVV